ncbi:MAG: lipid A biosynthesis acyltransferase [Planctomycetaceae bacterium]|nr:lipid A biosynthesis acyltransferase [Planctomycetaceae bacterium]|tara:strand:- start:7844 stop:8755 length:912 start_codon:yes stop_codon:yes gene_type:complete
MRRIPDYLIYLAVRSAFCLLQIIPAKEILFLAEPLLHLISDVLKIRAGVIDENLRFAFPNLSAEERVTLRRMHWRHLLLMVHEIANANRKIHLTNWRDHIQFHNKQQLVHTLLERRPKVLVSGHFGNFEVSGVIVGLFGFSMFTIARPLDNPFLDDFFNKQRATYGLQMLPKQDSASAAEAKLAEGTSLVVLGDQAAGDRDCWVDFFGRPASTHKAIAIFGLSFSAPLMVVYGKRTDGPLQFEIGCQEVVDPNHLSPDSRDVFELTQWYTSTLEKIICTAPDQYWWAHRRWKKRRMRQRRRAA